MPVIREKRQVKSAGPVGVVRMNLGESEKYSRIADATQKLTSIGIKEMGRQARIQGEKMAQEVTDAQIIALNPETGKPKALDWVGEGRFFGRTGAEAYERVVKERFQSSMENELKLKAGEIALKFKNNPYGAEQYKQQMDEYVKSMALGSEVDGKPTYYTNFIMEQGAQYIASTTLHMQEEQINRQRQVTANSIIENADARLDAVRDYAKLGKDATVLIESIVGSVGDGEDSFLLNQGASSKYRQAAAAAYAQGVIDKSFEDLGHISAGKVASAIKLGDSTGLSAQEKNVFDEAAKYMFRTVKIDGEETSVLDYDALSAVSGYADASAKSVADDYNSDIQARRFEIEVANERYVTDVVLDVAKTVSILDNADISSDAAVDSIVGAYNADQASIQSRAEDLSTATTVAEFNEQRQDVKESYAKRLIAAAYKAIEGDPQSVGAMINRALDNQSTSELSGKGKAAIEALLQITTIDDNNFLDGVVSDFASNDVRSTAAFASEKALFQQELSTGYIRNIGNSTSSVTANELLAEFETRVRDFDFLSATQKSRYIEEGRNQAVSVFLASQIGSYVTEADGTRRKVTSADLAAAAQYAANPDDKEGVPLSLVDAVDTAKVRAGSAGYVESRLVQLSSRLGTEEGRIAQRNKNKEQISNMLSSTKTEDSKSNRDLSERLISESLEDPEAYFRSPDLLDYSQPATQRLYSVIESGVVPTTLANNFQQLANGTFTGNEEEARSLISLYAHFSSQPRGQSTVNVWNDSNMSEATKAKLEAISILGTAIEAPIQNIATQLSEATTPDANAARLAAFKDVDNSRSDAEFVINAVPDAATNQKARALLVNLAKYLHGPMEAGEIQKSLAEYYDRTFVDTEGYIKDYASMSGTKSQYALDAVFTNQELKSYFINKVNVEVAIAAARFGGQAKMISNSNIKNRAFLMPLGSSSGGVVNYMLVEERSGTIVPVQNPETGIPFQFSTAETDVVQEAQRLAVKTYNTLPTLEQVKDMRAQRAKNANKLTGTGTTGVGVSPAGSEFPGLN